MDHRRDSFAENWSFSDLRRINLVCEEFEQLLKQEDHVTIEQLIAQNTGLPRRHLLDRLLRVELQFRLSAGGLPELDDYRCRFPVDANIVDRIWHEYVAECQQKEFATTALPQQQPRTQTAHPEKVGRFVIRRFLGRGAFGAVYQAYDPERLCEVAVKVPHPEILASSRLLEDARQEAQIGEHLDHPHLVRTISVSNDNDEGQLIVVQQYIDGENLAEWYFRTRPTPDQVAKLMIPVAQALNYLHEQGFVHRDLKPGNILVDKNEKAFVADFGLTLHESQQRHPDHKSELAGTYPYMSPEQIRRQTQLIDGQTDLWSFGVILYRLLTDRYPFGGPPPGRQSDDAEYIRDLAIEIEDHDPRPPRQINPAVSRKLEKVCLTCLEKRKRDRYRTGNDLAEDLQLALERSKDAMETDSRDKKPQIVPKGLRSFDAIDASFFLQLLPGPRSLDGIPTCLNFWKNRLTGTTGDGPIDVGVIYGPSGCGKSSLVKAGLLPLLGEKIVPILIEATPIDTERRLLEGLRNILPNLPPDISTIDACRLVSQQGAGHDRKILVVFDQFEQWLNAHSSPGKQFLLSAMRNCNGTRLQSLFLVRDDFWTPMTRFMHELEIPLQEDINAKGVDLFSCEHAKMVLLGLGRAYGRLPASDQELTSEQQQFLTDAVDSLAEGNRVICVRLTLFVEMMKERTWIPAELTEVGGAMGIGVRFLDEKFGTRAPAVYKPFRDAARRILSALLPQFGTELKGQMKTTVELREAAGDVSLEDFEQLLYILDIDLKLLTPVVPERPSSMSNTINRSFDLLHYQLAHDYLVPSIRSWLSAEERSTPKGRARMQLRELALAWNDKPDPRRLPAFGEWLAIWRFVHPRDWTKPERRMMDAIHRRVVRRGVTALVVSLLLFAGGAFIRHNVARDRERLAAANLHARILEAPLPQILILRNQNRPISRELLLQIRQSLETENLNPKDRLRLALFLADIDLDQANFLFRHLLVTKPGEVATPDEVAAILSLQQEIFTDFIPRFWKVLDDPTQSSSRRLRAGAALIRWAPEDDRWSPHLSDFVATLVSESPANVPHWEAALGSGCKMLIEPLRQMLIEPLQRESRLHEQADSDLVATMFLSFLLQDQCNDLVELAISAHPRQLPVIVDSLRRHRSKACEFLKSYLIDSAAPTSSKECEAHAKQQVNAALCLLLLDEELDFWPLLIQKDDPRVRSYLIQWTASTGVPADRFMDRLHADEINPSSYQALILIVGEYDHGRLEKSRRQTEGVFLRKILNGNDDPGIHVAAESLLKKWGISEQSAYAKDSYRNPLASGKKWFYNSLGQSFAILKLRAKAGADTVPRQVAFATRKVTVGEFKRSLVKKNEFNNENDNLPFGGIDLVRAAKYCNWLSEQDEIPKEEYVYIELDEFRIQLADDFANKKGYRLPTATEWNEACMAGATTSRPFGETDELLPFYAWFAANSQGQLRENGLLKPNRFGLYDMLGNLAEIVHFDEPWPQEDQSLGVQRAGMSFRQAPEPSKISARSTVIANGNENHGFRVVRSLK